MPLPPPPKDDSKKKKDRKPRLTNGSSQSLSGTLIRPKPIHANSLPRQPPPGTLMYGPLGGHPGHHPQHPGMHPQQHHPQSRQFHTFSHRRFVNNGHGPHMGPPMGMPMQVMLPPQYATLQPSRTNKKKKKDKMNGYPVGMPVAPPMYAYPPPASIVQDQRPLGMSNRKLAQSAANLDDSGNSGAESPSGTGIYRRKGHLNERAFSYSIRQEHRSRSHGSLASLQFNPPDMKKEREIAQMVAGLDLNGGESTLQRRSMAAGSSGTFGKPRR